MDCITRKAGRTGCYVLVHSRLFTIGHHAKAGGGESPNQKSERAKNKTEQKKQKLRVSNKINGCSFLPPVRLVKYPPAKKQNAYVEPIPLESRSWRDPASPLGGLADEAASRQASLRTPRQLTDNVTSLASKS